MTDLFTTVDPVMSRKMFHHFLDAHNTSNSSQNTDLQVRHSETVRSELEELQQNFTELIGELEQLKKSQIEQENTSQKISSQPTHEQRQTLLESVYLLERKIKLLQEQPAHNNSKVEMLQSRIAQIKQKLQ